MEIRRNPNEIIGRGKVKHGRAATNTGEASKPKDGAFRLPVYFVASEGIDGL
jgi:hypothetical protein